MTKPHLIFGSFQLPVPLENITWLGTSGREAYPAVAMAKFLTCPCVPVHNLGVSRESKHLAKTLTQPAHSGGNSPPRGRSPASLRPSKQTFNHPRHFKLRVQNRGPRKGRPLISLTSSLPTQQLIVLRIDSHQGTLLDLSSHVPGYHILQTLFRLQTPSRFPASHFRAIPHCEPCFHAPRFQTIFGQPNSELCFRITPNLASIWTAPPCLIISPPITVW